MVTLQWVNASSEEDATSQAHARHTIRAQAMEYNRVRQKRERQRQHTEYLLQQPKQRRLPGLDISILVNRQSESPPQDDFTHMRHRPLQMPRHDENKSIAARLRRRVTVLLPCPLDTLGPTAKSGRPRSSINTASNDCQASLLHGGWKHQILSAPQRK